MSAHWPAPRLGFGVGHAAITRVEDIASSAGIGFGILKMTAGEHVTGRTMGETAWLLMSGRAEISIGETSVVFERRSLFDESASCVHVPAGTDYAIRALEACEFTEYACANTRAFPVRWFGPMQVPNEHRGKGQVRDRSLRFVRTIFDRTNSPKEVELVLGEVVTLPGGWSSYPPHHHPQPEIYHYRFTLPQGYGHAELGESVLKVRNGDTVRIDPGLDHAQCAAPGYGMYYA